MAKGKWRVVWTEAATQDLIEIVSFVARKSPVNARRLLLKLRSRADSLERSPERGRPVPELEFTSTRVWRELVVKPHLIVYRIREIRRVASRSAILHGNLDTVLPEGYIRGGTPHEKKATR